MRWISRIRWTTGFLLALLLGCAPQPKVQPLSMVLYPKQAARNEPITISLNKRVEGAKVFIAGTQTAVGFNHQQTLVVTVPANAPAGPQEVRVESGAEQATQSLNVLGTVVQNQLILTLKPGVNLAEAQKRLEGLGYKIIAPFQALGGQGGDNPCSGSLGIIDVGGKPLGQALAELEALDIVYRPDPQSDWDVSAVNYLGAIGVAAAHQRGFTGKGITIAVLDTGLDAGAIRSDLLNRVSPGFDFVNNDATVEDDFARPDPSEPNLQELFHGSPIAILAAGAKQGVAPEAQVLPVKVCSGAGECLASNVVKGVCYALGQVPDRSKLVLNLSLGGDTPVSVLEAILAYALKQGSLIAAAGGNQGPDIQDGPLVVRTPKHYPAAYKLEGLVAVAALAQNAAGGWQPAAFSSRGVNIDYLDIAAPGADIALLGFNYSGTSFATPLAAGALALWRQANPGLGPAEIEAKLKGAATPLPPYTTHEVGAGLLNLSSQP